MFAICSEMSAAFTPSADDPSVAGGAVSGGAGSDAVFAGRLLLGYGQRMMDAGRQVVRHINLIARQRLEGQPLSRLGPAGFNPTAVNALAVEAVGWTAALRERLQAVVPPTFRFRTKPSLEEPTPPGRGAAHFLPKEVPNPTEDDWHVWRELAKPFRLGPGGVAAAMRLIAGMSNAAVVRGICERLRKALIQLGTEADVPLIAALQAAALALCPLVPAPEGANADPEAAEAQAAADAARAPEPRADAPAAHVPPAAEPLAEEPPAPEPATDAKDEPRPEMAAAAPDEITDAAGAAAGTADAMPAAPPAAAAKDEPEDVAGPDPPPPRSDGGPTAG
jgi:hypothetical protein